MAAIIALAVFLGIRNASKSIQQLIVDECNAALTTSPFTDVSVTQLRDACFQDNADYLRRTVMWTGIRAGIQVSPHPNPPVFSSLAIPRCHCFHFRWFIDFRFSFLRLLDSGQFVNS